MFLERTEIPTSKMLRALAPVPAVMESPREAMMSMSTGRSWCTVRWAGGWRSLVVKVIMALMCLCTVTYKAENPKKIDQV